MADLIKSKIQFKSYCYQLILYMTLPPSTAAVCRDCGGCYIQVLVAGARERWGLGFTLVATIVF